MYVADQPMLSDESEEEGAGESHEEMTYRRKYQMLLERCEVLQQDNERLVHRIQQVYKYTRQVRKERKFLMDRLDNYRDNWRQGIAQLIQDGGVPHSKPSTTHKYHQSHSSEKHSRKPASSKKSTSKEKSDLESSGKKHSKESNKNIGKNVQNYNFMQ